MPELPPLSVLDLAPVVEGGSTRDALLNSLDLVRRVDRLGYARHWVAEHHNSAVHEHGLRRRSYELLAAV